ncbi:aspartic proteinase CDR1-like [Amaranthus tricolor]|uniref:aspartic proteinase CDR1-like n=1 Tax=Amaranthus tricolor TaxID=29722 RepID=UPI0025897E40|nr:aspartic proteinase CDR1-like [Amaranthus tricolor]
MHILFYFLFAILLSINIFITRCKSQKDDFTIDLVHRYSTISPFYNSSMTHKERLQMLALHSASRHKNLKKLVTNNHFDTNIIPNDGDYLIKLAVGNPPVNLFAIADTGSDLIWVQCEPCYLCYSQTTTIMFDPQNSRTFSTLPCSSSFCTNSTNMQCNDDDTSTECEYYYAYGNGSTITSGIMGTDLFTFNSNMTSSPCVFGCGLVQEGDGFDSNAAGLVGLGGGPLSLISQMGPTISYKFSYCLTPFASNSTSKLTLGGNTKNGQPKFMTPLVSLDSPTYYAVNLKGLRVGSEELIVNKPLVIDSGSTLTYLDASVYSRLEDMVQGVILGTPVSDPPQELSLCYDNNLRVDQLSFDIALQFDGGDLILKGLNIFIDYDEYFCLAFVPSTEDGDPLILGNVAQVNFKVEFDLKGKTVSFTPTTCN